MRLTGTLRTWHDDRGFGFIAPTQGGREVFVHVSAFPRDGARPLPGEKLGYELGRGSDGKPQAVRVQRLAWAGAVAPSTAGRPPARPRRSLQPLLLVAALLGLGVFAYRHFQGAVAPLPMTQAVPPASEPPAQAPREPAAQPVAAARRDAAAAQPIKPAAAPAREVAAPPPPTWRCDGRTHCSQMSSCAEATYFLRNCPGTRMDGDGDGIPCEEQWCTGWLAR